MIDQHGDGLAEIRRRLARWQHVVTIEGGECQSVASEIRGRDDPIGLQFVAKQYQVEPRVQLIGLRRAQYERVRLLLRSARHVGRAHIACKYLCTDDLRDSINAEFRSAWLHSTEAASKPFLRTTQQKRDYRGAQQ